MSSKSERRKLLKGVVDAFKDHWEKGWQEKRVLPADKKRAEELHPSSFPYCGLKHAHDLILAGGDSDIYEMPATMHYYVDVGTVTHSILQEYLGKLTVKKHKVKGVLIGDWHCKDKDCGGVVEFSAYRKCPKCKGDTSYEELGIQFGARTHGHTDGLYKVWLDGYEEDPYYFVIDYKTSSVKAIQWHRQKGAFPYVSNKFQIRSYIAYLEMKYEEYDLHIDGWMLIYLARDKPMTEYEVIADILNDEDREWVNKYIRRSDKAFHHVRKRIAVKQIDEDDIEKLISLKLCPSRAFYTANVHDKWEPCPLAENGKCFTGPEQYMKKLVRQYNKDRAAEDDEDDE